MPRTNHTFMLRLLRRNPDSVPMGRIGEYIAEFAALLGPENKPRFKGIKKASTGFKAYVPAERVAPSRARMATARLNPDSQPGKHWRSIQALMGDDAIAEAQVLDAQDNVIYVIFGNDPAPADVQTERVYQEGTVDGVVTGLVGADDTMHLHMRDGFDRDLKIVVRDEALARRILTRFRAGSIRLTVRGSWVRTGTGWAPEASKCTASSFEVLEDTPAASVFAEIARLPDNGWKDVDDPITTWADLRGLH